MITKHNNGKINYPQSLLQSDVNYYGETLPIRSRNPQLNISHKYKHTS